MGNNMQKRAIFDTERLREEIEASHERCRRFGVDPENNSRLSLKPLSPEELSLRLAKNRSFLDIAIAQIEEIYQFVAGAGFVMSLTDREGYILYHLGDPVLIKKMKETNCRPGYRWTESDVGTSALGLALVRKIPVQINETEHFCRRGHESICSASPVLDSNGELLGVVAMSGNAKEVNPHTLGMVITATRSIENQLRIEKASNELLLQANHLEAVIDSIDSGVIDLDKNGIIQHINRHGRNIFQWEGSIEGMSIQTLFGNQIILEELMQPGFEFVDREVSIQGKARKIQMICTARPIFNTKEELHGTILIFHEIKRIKKLVNDMAGSHAQFTFQNIIGKSPEISETRKMAMIASSQNSTVLLQGETGTGKELFAQAIHNNSIRQNYPFVAINCAAIPKELLESELFGYAGKAFTGAGKKGRPGKFELADGGTLFLDEIGDMSVDMQAKILRVIQSGEVVRIGEYKPTIVDVRIIAATHMDLQKAVKQKDFREDLFYRINVFPIQIPALRHRFNDIDILSKYFLNRLSISMGKRHLKFSKEVEKVLNQHPWPGNVRELENVIERAINLSETKKIEPNSLGMENVDRTLKLTIGSRLSDLERQAILDTLETVDHNYSKAASALGISRGTLYNKIKKYNLST
jgi:sigma-54 dependent transcriptional regulator, acetoin dehydrogenase operon transcriptional activator AcoR